MLEEVIVTARKREESLQSVPISISVVDGEWIVDNAVRTFEQLSYSVPNFTVNESPIDTNIFIRGIGSAENQGFEQSVGLFSDGVYWGRARQARSPFFDVERIEVLKGPQGILFGKNTTAGAVSITTARPTAEPSARAGIYYEPDADERVVEGVISGPLSESLRGRLAVRGADMDGWLVNTAISADEPSREEVFVRGSLEWDISPDVDATFRLEHGELDVEGSTMQITEVGPWGDLFARFDPAFEADFDDRRSVGGTGIFVQPESSDTDSTTASVTLNWYTEPFTLTSITGYTTYDFADVFDADISALPQAQKLFSSDFEQWSQEVRLLSPAADAGGIDWITGVYWQTSDLDVQTRDDIDLALLQAPAGSRYYVTGQTSDLFAVFGQATWHMTDRWRITGGLRWVDEEKDAGRFLDVTNLGTTQPNPALEPFFAAALGTFPHDLEGNRSEGQVLPSLVVQWDATDSGMLYASYSKGFKGGGFDEQLTSGDPDDWEFEDETVDTYELGAKWSPAGGRAALNVALFRSEYSDLQVSAFDGLAGFVVGNAADATSEGVELDGSWAVTPNLRLGGAVAWLDARYESFENAACTASQSTAHEMAGLPSPCLQDLSGSEPLYSPDWSGNLYASHEATFGRGGRWMLRTRLEANFTDSFFVTQDLDPNLEQDGFMKLNLRFGLVSLAHGWEIALVGKNLTDELTTSFGNDVPILTGAFFKFADRPRTVGIQGRLSF
ncbi:MAG: TonB-dependent receptor [Halieaceae bacterium]|nr:TonB-dependent receptor [Halieaceae bacterium]